MRLVRGFTGSNHHTVAFTMRFAGGILKKGVIHGQRAEFGLGSVQDRLHNIHAKLLHQPGLDDSRLQARSQRLDARLTGADPAGVVKGIIA
jgi:hypothetical protein